jgi:hypothetical protein
MVPGNDHNMTAAGCSHPTQETIIELLRPVAGRAGIEHITGNQQSIDLFLFNGLRQPIQKRSELLIAFPAVKRAA